MKGRIAAVVVTSLLFGAIVSAQQVNIVRAGGGGVSSISVTAPITSTGGATPTIGCTSATTSTAGCVTASSQIFSGAKTFDTSVTSPSFISSSAATGYLSNTTSGNNAFGVAVNGGRVDLGTGADDYLISDGTRIVAGDRFGANDLEVPTNGALYLDGTGRSLGIAQNGAAVRILGVYPLTPVADQGINLGAPAVRWSNLYIGEINNGISSALTFSSVPPTVTSACTDPSVVNGGATSFQVDVGTTCTGVTTIVLGLPTAVAGWQCNGYNKTTATVRLDQTADTTTAATIVNTSKTTGLATDFVDGADLVISCTAR